MAGLILTTILSLVYAALFGWLILGVIRLKRSDKAPENWPSVTVVVPLHNEENHLKATLDALATQEYPGTWEVFCVDDRSTDKTPEMLREICEKYANFHLLQVPHDAPDLPAPKKRALETGFAKSKAEILMTMDADCIPGSHWIRSMAAHFHGKISIVQGPKAISGSSRPLHRFQKLETLGLTMVEAAGFSNKQPILASAAALAYKRELFYKVGGFADLMHFHSGDDDMLVHKMAQEDIDFCYNACPEARITTAPVDTWKGLLNQRARWSSNGTNYSDKVYVLLLTTIYLFFVWTFIGPWLAVTGLISWKLFLIPFVTKCVCDFVFLGLGAYKLQSLPLMLNFPLTVAIQIPLIVFAVPLGQLKLFRWHL